MVNTRYKVSCSNHFNIYLDTSIDWKGYQLFDIHRDGEHHDYILKSKKTGKFHWCPESKFKSQELEALIHYINSEFQFLEYL